MFAKIHTNFDTACRAALASRQNASTVLAVNARAQWAEFDQLSDVPFSWAVLALPGRITRDVDKACAVARAVVECRGDCRLLVKCALRVLGIRGASERAKLAGEINTSGLMLYRWGAGITETPSKKLRVLLEKMWVSIL